VTPFETPGETPFRPFPNPILSLLHFPPALSPSFRTARYTTSACALRKPAALLWFWFVCDKVGPLEQEGRGWPMCRAAPISIMLVSLCVNYCQAEFPFSGAVLQTTVTDCDTIYLKEK